MNQLVRFDTNALSQLNRALIGFDDIFNNFETRFANQINNTYPPYNILKHDEDTYEIEIAVTGFEKDEITVEIDQNNLVVKGARKEVDIKEPVYLHRVWPVEILLAVGNWDNTLKSAKAPLKMEF